MSLNDMKCISKVTNVLLNKLAYVWPTQSTQIVKTIVFVKRKPKSILTTALQVSAT